MTVYKSLSLFDFTCYVHQSKCLDWSHFRKRLTRKKSTDSTSRRKYMDDDADDDDEVFAASDEDGAEENGKGSRVGGGEGWCFGQ